MQESTLVQYIAEKATAEALQQGIQQGEKTRALEDILEVISFRLGGLAVQRFKPILYAIDDGQRLKGLFRAALAAENSEDFQQALDSSNSET